MSSGVRNYRFIDTGGSPEFFVNGLHEVELMGCVARFVFYVLKPCGDEMMAEAPLTLVAPVEAIGPAIALTVCRVPRLVIPVLGQAAMSLLQ